MQSSGLAEEQPEALERQAQDRARRQARHAKLLESHSGRVALQTRNSIRDVFTRLEGFEASGRLSHEEVEAIKNPSEARKAAHQASHGGLFEVAARSKRVLSAVAACTPPEQPLATPWDCLEALKATRGDVQQAVLRLVPAGPTPEQEAAAAEAWRCVSEGEDEGEVRCVEEHAPAGGAAPSGPSAAGQGGSSGAYMSEEEPDYVMVDNTTDSFQPAAADKGKAAVPGPALAGHAASDVVRLDEGCVPPAAGAAGEGNGAAASECGPSAGEGPSAPGLSAE